MQSRPAARSYICTLAHIQTTSLYQRRQVCSIAKQIGLGSEELNAPCEDSFFPLLASIIHPWREVFASLLTEVDLSDIDVENSGRSEQEKRIAALRKWKARNGQGATYEVLVRALLDIGKVDRAETLCGQLQALQGVVLKLHDTGNNTMLIPQCADDMLSLSISHLAIYS